MAGSDIFRRALQLESELKEAKANGDRWILAVDRAVKLNEKLEAEKAELIQQQKYTQKRVESAKANNELLRNNNKKFREECLRLEAERDDTRNQLLEAAETERILKEGNEAEGMKIKRLETELHKARKEAVASKELAANRQKAIDDLLSGKAHFMAKETAK